MTSTVGLAAPHWTASQNNPDATHNSALDVLDSCIAGQNVIDFPSDADYTLVVSGAYPREWQYAVIEMTDTLDVLTVKREVVLTTHTRMWHVFNNTDTVGTGQILTFIGATGTGIDVGIGKRAILQNDGTNVVRWTVDSP